jgi:hypothetical protein
MEEELEEEGLKLLVYAAGVEWRKKRALREETSITRQHASAYVSIRQHTSAYVSIRQHTSAYVSIRQHTSAYVSIEKRALR